MPKIFVICGHGAGDPGATGNGYTEAERVRALGKRIKALGRNSVTLGDVNRNYYADKGISNLTISKDYQIVELHMDSSASPSPHGGHVVIKSGFKPDAYDKALADMMTDILPGRSTLIDERGDLANPKRAAAKGYGYRLLECGFITNKNDVKTFNSRMDEIAKRILSAFGIKASGSTSTSTSKPTTTKPSTSTSSSNKLKVDGYWGPSTTRRLQQIFKTTVDGVVSNQHIEYRDDNPGLDSGWEWEDNPNGYSPLIKAIQKKVGATQDGYIGPKTIKAIQKWMGTVQDGYFSGPSPCIKELQKWCNKQK